MTHGKVAAAIALGAGYFGVLAVGFVTGFGNTWPIIAFVLAGVFLLDRN